MYCMSFLDVRAFSEGKKYTQYMVVAVWWCEHGMVEWTAMQALLEEKEKTLAGTKEARFQWMKSEKVEKGGKTSLSQVSR